MKVINPYKSSHREIGRIFHPVGKEFNQTEGYIREIDLAKSVSQGWHQRGAGGLQPPVGAN